MFMRRIIIVSTELFAMWQDVARRDAEVNPGKRQVRCSGCGDFRAMRLVTKADYAGGMPD